jgi:hypothetical protein
MRVRLLLLVHPAQCLVRGGPTQVGAALMTAILPKNTESLFHLELRCVPRKWQPSVCACVRFSDCVRVRLLLLVPPAQCLVKRGRAVEVGQPSVRVRFYVRVRFSGCARTPLVACSTHPVPGEAVRDTVLGSLTTPHPPYRSHQQQQGGSGKISAEFPE